MFSAITWNRHRIHYEPDAARAEGHADVVAQRALIGNLFARHVQTWLGTEGRLQRLGWRVLASATPGQRLRCQGAITGCLADDALWHPQTGPQTGPPNGHQSGLNSEACSELQSAPQDAPRGSLRLRYDARLTRLDDGATVAVAEGDLCIPATR
jgi:hypothetical protein